MTLPSEARIDANSEGLWHEEPVERIARKTAAVAVILRSSRSGQELLLMRRADREGDPWSGQVAFPGGRVERADRSFRETAAREAFEELGLVLDTERDFIGYMSPFHTHVGEMPVVPALFNVSAPAPILPNAEVSSFRWIALRAIRDPKNRSAYVFESGGIERSLPSYSLDGYLVWGLTERMLSALLELGPASLPETTPTRSRTT